MVRKKKDSKKMETWILQEKRFDIYGEKKVEAKTEREREQRLRKGDLRDACKNSFRFNCNSVNKIIFE